MLYLGIDEHRRQLTVNLRAEDGKGRNGVRPALVIKRNPGLTNAGLAPRLRERTKSDLWIVKARTPRTSLV
jgi:hypothetical protein